MTMAPKYILNYFDLPGRAEAVRIMFHAAGVEFTDNRLDRLEWNKQKFDSMCTFYCTISLENFLPNLITLSLCARP